MIERGQIGHGAVVLEGCAHSDLHGVPVSRGRGTNWTNHGLRECRVVVDREREGIGWMSNGMTVSCLSDPSLFPLIKFSISQLARARSTNLRHRSFIRHLSECHAYSRRGNPVNTLSTMKVM